MLSQLAYVIIKLATVNRYNRTYEYIYFCNYAIGICIGVREAKKSESDGKTIGVGERDQGSNERGCEIGIGDRHKLKERD